ncbi:MAG: heparan-alpha-glucosaminide N-acetyltransferase domain-containing protein [Candidatus Izemoplasmatales bacterium]|nr:heparan-alpha-glucosaminide N-acetyltransferase domain-containing protein [Candidatus Izemoplasmatales bacterium]
MKSRVWELDFLRGLSIILMVFDHLMYDLKSLPYWFADFRDVNHPIGNWLQEAAVWYWNSWLRADFHFVFVSIFLLVSGISFTFSRSNWIRGMKFTLVAVLISVVTMGVEMLYGLDIGIIFGIIHMFAVGTLLTLLVRKIWNNDVFILILGVAIVAYGVSFHFWDVPYYANLSWEAIPKIIIGIRGYGADHFGIFPYVGMIMIGTVIGNIFYKDKKSLLPKWDGKWNRPFQAAGRYTLWIFVVHQPVIMLLVVILGTIFGYHFE